VTHARGLVSVNDDAHAQHAQLEAVQSAHVPVQAQSLS
jgi:hypothetical protein